MKSGSHILYFKCSEGVFVALNWFVVVQGSGVYGIVEPWNHVWQKSLAGKNYDIEFR